MIFVDFKRVEFSMYRNFDNTIVMNQMKDFIEFLKNILKQMDERYSLFENSGVANITEYNKKFNDELPFIIICVDEIAFVSSQKNQSEIWQDLITLIQMGRAAGIILFAATQCPDHTQINTAFRRQMDGKLIGRLRQQTDLKICGIDSKEDVTNFDTGEFLIDLVGIGKKKIKSLYINGLTDSLTNTKNRLTDGLTLEKNRLTENNNQDISGFDDFKHGENALIKKNRLTEKIDLLKLCENYFLTLESDAPVPTFKEAQKLFSELTVSKYKTIKIKLCKEGIIYKTSPKGTKYKIK